VLDTNVPNRSQSRSTSSGCLQVGILIILWVFIAGVTLGRLGSQLLASTALTQIPGAAWIAFPLVQGVILVLSLLLMVFLWKSQPWRSILLLWLAASGYILLLAPASLLKLESGQAQALLTILLSLVYLLALYWLSNRRSRRQPESTSDNSPSALDLPSIPEAQSFPNNNRRAFWVVWLLVPLLVWPWLLWGALGSLLDTLLQVLVGLTFGWVVAASLERLVIPGLRSAGFGRAAAYLLGGFATGSAIMIFASGLGYAFGGIQTLLVLCLPPLGWLALGIWDFYNGSSKAVAFRTGKLALLPALLLVGLCAAFPLALIDPDELAMIISGSAGEILGWGITAAALSGMIGLLISAIMLFWILSTRNRPSEGTPRFRTGLVVAGAIAWLAALVVYFAAGQPGLYGEELFVLLDTQADLSPARQITDPVERRQFVYNTLVANAGTTQADLRDQLERFNLEYTPYYLVNGIRVRGGPLVRLWLTNQPGVAEVLDVPVLRPLPKLPPTASGNASMPDKPQWNLTLVNADRVWQEFGATGQGIVIGQSDSGAQGDHPELADSYRGANSDGTTSNDYNWYDPWNGSTHPTDIGGHGTHTLGSILGNHTGVAPDAQWIGCVNLARNLGNLPYYLDCMQFMLAPFPISGDPFTDGDPARGAQVLNNSWGCPEIEGCHPDSLRAAVKALAEAGIFIVASAGNDGPLCSSLSDPIAIYDQVFSVGAANEFGDWVFFSSIGPVTADGSGRVKPDILAPGDLVLSSMPQNSYAELSGTSMAGPHVAGVVALMWSANPKLVGDIDRTRQILQETARPYDGPLPDCAGATDTPSTAVGYGMLDAYEAVKAALNP